MNDIPPYVLDALLCISHTELLKHCKQILPTKSQNDVPCIILIASNINASHEDLFRNILKDGLT